MKNICLRKVDVSSTAIMMGILLASSACLIDVASAQAPSIDPKDVVARPDVYDVSAYKPFRTKHMNMVSALEGTDLLLRQNNCRVEGGINGPQTVTPVLSRPYSFSLAGFTLHDAYTFPLPTFSRDLLSNPDGDLTYGVVELRWSLRVLIEPSTEGYRLSLALDQGNFSSRGSACRVLGCPWALSSWKTLASYERLVSTLAHFDTDAISSELGKPAFVLPNGVAVRLRCD